MQEVILSISIQKAYVAQFLPFLQGIRQIKLKKVFNDIFIPFLDTAFTSKCEMTYLQFF